MDVHVSSAAAAPASVDVQGDSLEFDDVLRHLRLTNHLQKLVKAGCGSVAALRKASDKTLKEAGLGPVSVRRVQAWQARSTPDLKARSARSPASAEGDELLHPEEEDAQHDAATSALVDTEDDSVRPAEAAGSALSPLEFQAVAESVERLALEVKQCASVARRCSLEADSLASPLITWTARLADQISESVREMEDGILDGSLLGVEIKAGMVDAPPEVKDNAAQSGAKPSYRRASVTLADMESDSASDDGVTLSPTSSGYTNEVAAWMKKNVDDEFAVDFMACHIVSALLVVFEFLRSKQEPGSFRSHSDALCEHVA